MLKDGVEGVGGLLGGCGVDVTPEVSDVFSAITHPAAPKQMKA